MIIIGTNDVIIRYLRVAKGANAGCVGANECGTNIFLNRNASNAILDHISSTWNQDDNISGFNGPRNITASWNLLGESVGAGDQPHPTGPWRLPETTPPAPS